MTVICLNFFTGRTKFLQQRQSLAVSAAGRSISRNSVVVSTACARIRGPTRACVELDSEVEVEAVVSAAK